MNLEQMLEAIHASPADRLAWLALADCLEEDSQSERANLLRLWVTGREMAAGPERARSEAEVLAMLARGVEPCIPTITNSVGMTFALVPPGVFLMGSPAQEHSRDSDELQHEVEITEEFYIAIHPVTQEQFAAVLGHNPSAFCSTGTGADKVAGLDTSLFPAEQVLFSETMEFCAKLSAKRPETRARRRYRLPTEAEWEYACRAAGLHRTPFSIADGVSLGAEHGCFDTRHPYGKGKSTPWIEQPMQVGSFRPNALGMFDMHGTIWEWTSDHYSNDYFRHSPRQNPKGPTEGNLRTVRGGAWISAASCCRSAERFGETPTPRKRDQGFRVVMVRG